MLSQKAIVNFEVSKGDRKYIFSMEMGAPLGECYDACYEVLTQIVEASRIATEKAARKDESSVEAS